MRTSKQRLQQENRDKQRIIDRRRRFWFITREAGRDWLPGLPSSPERYRERLLSRFWAKVDKTPGLGPKGDCWQWTSPPSNGYGQFGLRINGVSRPIRAHVLAWVHIYGHPAPPQGWHVCHKCNNKICVREEHLFPGTPRQNVHHAMATGLIRPAAPKPEPAEWRIPTLTSEQAQMIRIARESKKLALADVAFLAQMDKSHLSRLERGTRGARLSQIHFLLNFLGIDPEAFGLASCQLTAAWPSRIKPAKYKTEAPQYVYRKVPFAQLLRRQVPTWIEAMCTSREPMILEIAEVFKSVGAKQSDVLKEAGISRQTLKALLRGDGVGEGKLLSVLRYVEALKQQRAA